jgi:hypothetical protein
MPDSPRSKMARRRAASRPTSSHSNGLTALHPTRRAASVTRTTPSAARRATSAAVRPSASRSTSAVCSPRRGDGRGAARRPRTGWPPSERPGDRIVDLGDHAARRRLRVGERLRQREHRRRRHARRHQPRHPGVARRGAEALGERGDQLVAVGHAGGVRGEARVARPTPARRPPPRPARTGRRCRRRARTARRRLERLVGDDLRVGAAEPPRAPRRSAAWPAPG